MSSHREYPRSSRVAVQLQRAIDQMIREEFSDPCFEGVTITSVDLSPDLRNARVFVGRLGKPMEEAVAELGRRSGRMRGILGRRLKLRRVPELAFFADELPDEADSINQLIRAARARDSDGGGQ